MAGRVIDTDKGWGKLARQLATLRANPLQVEIGIFADQGSDLLLIATVNEFGSADGHVPERSYLRSTIDQGIAQVFRDLERAVDRTLDGANLRTELGLVGEKWVGEVKLTIRDLDTPPNAPSTIARKGFDNPLVGPTGRLRNSQTWRISKQGT